MENPENSEVNETTAGDDNVLNDMGRNPSPVEMPPSTVHAPPPVARPELPQKSPILAAFLSAMPGLGNIYNGLYRRGITFFLVFVTLFFIAGHNEQEPLFALLVPCIIFVWFFNVFDAYRQTILINYGYRADVDEAKIGMKGWGLAPGIFLVVVGFYGLLDRYFDISLDLIFDHWPILLILGGGGLIFQHFRERQARTEEV